LGLGAATAQDGLAPEGALRTIQRLASVGLDAAAQRALDAALSGPQRPSPQTVALLRAATSPFAGRPRAFLSVAEAHPSTRAADVALAAACVAGIDPAAAGYVAPTGGPDASDAARHAVDDPAFVAAAARLLAARRSAPDADLLALDIAERALAKLERFDAPAVRVAPDTPLAAPAFLRETVRCRLSPRASTSASAAFALRFGADGGDAALPTAGSYVLELAAESADRRARRVVHVSDLDVVALAYPASVVVFATLRGAPQAGVAARFLDDEGLDDEAAPPARTDARGVSVLAARRYARGRVVAEFGAHRN
jgi:hypothetical protein